MNILTVATRVPRSRIGASPRTPPGRPDVCGEEATGKLHRYHVTSTGAPHTRERGRHVGRWHVVPIVPAAYLNSWHWRHSENITAAATSPASISLSRPSAPSHHRAMDKGKRPAATSSEAMWVSAKELFGIESDSDEERRPAPSSKASAPAPARGVDVGATYSGTGTGTGTGAVRASSSSAPAETQQVAPFEDGQYVRLRNRGRGGYLFANEDGRGVSIDHRRHMVNTAWAVQVLAARVLLRGAYGRYLSATGSAARSGHIGGYVAQCIVEFQDDHHIEWSVTRGKRGGVVLLRGMDGGTCALRANGRYLRWNKGVTYGGVDLNSISSMLEWEVQVIPLTAERPPYQPRPPNAAIVSSQPVSFFLA